MGSGDGDLIVSLHTYRSNPKVVSGLTRKVAVILSMESMETEEMCQMPVCAFEEESNEKV
jgi:hypothetical protein